MIWVLRMISHLWLLSLTAFVFPEGTGGQGDRGWFHVDIRWRHVGSYGLRLSWNARQLAYRRVDTVRLTAEELFSPGVVQEKNASVNDGIITILGLKPYTYYQMLVDGYRDNYTVFGATSLIRTLPTAPSYVDPPTGKAISTKELEVKWSAPSQPNGILKPYIVTCFNTFDYSESHSVTTKDNTTTSVTFKQLRPGMEYQCSVVASTYPANNQRAADCERRSALSDRIRTMALAPSRVPRPKGEAISSAEIHLTWSKPRHSNGILQPYLVTCFDLTHGSAPTNLTTEDSETTSVTVRGLTPKTEYQCLVVASTIPAVGQDPSQCESRSELSAPIWTKSSSTL
ncbi:unnamed protein product [Hydatigera taeniaeformis]|uniref:Fibronectin type-III domain-containing protein n=1 Tax=Hydatigena taeniaeformis TaxID=6205 RepID=A0A0R3WND0_HYDTA|nr:unnamed protein product [Hydatigera taeniaeformis]